MGRKPKTTEEKKGKVSISISLNNHCKLTESGMNKSQLINWLLEQHFNSLNNGN